MRTNFRCLSGIVLMLMIALGGWQTFARWAEARPLATLRGPERGISCAAFSPNGRILACGSADHHIWMWDTATWQRIEAPLPHKGSVVSLDFSPDGSLLASASLDHTVKLWDVDKKALRATLEGHKAPVMSAAFSPDGKIIASGSGRSIKPGTLGELILWDVAKGQHKATLPATGAVDSVVFSPDGKTLAASLLTGRVKLWHTGTLKESGTSAQFPRDATVNSIAFSPNGQILAIGLDYFRPRRGLGEVKICDARTVQEHAAWQVDEGPVEELAFSPDGKKLAAAASEKGQVIIWDVSTGKPVAQVHGHMGLVVCVAISPDGKALAAGSVFGNRPGEIKVWDLSKILESADRK